MDEYENMDEYEYEKEKEKEKDLDEAILFLHQLMLKEQYRQQAILRYLDKRKRRCFKKKIICKSKSVEAFKRVRNSRGHFVKYYFAGWVPITCV